MAGSWVDLEYLSSRSNWELEFWHVLVVGVHQIWNVVVGIVVRVGEVLNVLVGTAIVLIVWRPVIICGNVDRSGQAVECRRDDVVEVNEGESSWKAKIT